MQRPKALARTSDYDANGNTLLTVHLEQVTSHEQGRACLEDEFCRLQRIGLIRSDLLRLEEERSRIKEEHTRLERKLALLELQQIDPAIMDSAVPRIHFNGLSPIDDPTSPDGSQSPKVARQVAILRKLRPPPFKYAWHFYHDKHSDNDNYEGRLTLMKDDIVTAKPFWEVLNSFPLERLHLKDSVHFFKRGVKPVWEDPRNVKGGAWTFRVPKSQAEQFWKEVLMMAVGEQFADVMQPGTHS